MASWKDDARWVICDRKHEVFAEDDHFLVVEDEAFDYDGSYVVRTVAEYGVLGAACGASYEYLNTLDKASDADGVEALRQYIRYEAWYYEVVADDEEAAVILADMFAEATGEAL